MPGPDTRLHFHWRLPSSGGWGRHVSEGAWLLWDGQRVALCYPTEGGRPLETVEAGPGDHVYLRWGASKGPSTGRLKIVKGEFFNGHR